jgi:hypothetical protein
MKLGGAAPLEIDKSSDGGVNNGYEERLLTFTADESVNYGFRIQQKFGSSYFQIDDVEINCTDCQTASLSDLNDFQFNIYPNPAKDVISFQSELPLESVEIFSLTGSKVLSQSNNVRQVEVGNLAKGIYMLKASAVDGKVATQKLIKE